jgi:acetyl esterase/lipase
MNLPFGYLIGVTLVGTCTVFALAPRPRSKRLSTISWWLGMIVDELPFIALWLLTASTLLTFTQGDIAGLGGWTSFSLAVATAVGLVVIIWQATRARPATERASAEALGGQWRDAIAPELADRPRHDLPIVRILLCPWYVRRRDVERLADIRYGAHGDANLLDVFRSRSRPSDGPVLIYFHGGRFAHGRKNREARPLLYRLASQGWTCVSANYRLRPATFPYPLIDAKQVIAWVRRHGAEHGADAATVFVAGSSAGGHLAAIAALTPNDPAYQPGFEDVDTSVAAAIPLYGYFGPVDDDPRSSPVAHVRRDAPPFFIVQGGHDTFAPGFVEQARHFAAGLRRTSANPVVYLELPGAQHSFDLFHSIHFDTVVDGIEEFTSWVRSREAANT